MKRILLLLFISVSYSSDSQTPEVDWVSEFNVSGNTSNCYVNDIEPCKSGGVYVLISFNGTCDVNPFNLSNTYLVSHGESDIAILRLNELGHLIWSKQVGGLSYEYANKLVTSPSGDIYVSGVFSDSVDFDPGINEANAQSNGVWDGFILALDSNGIYLNSKTFGGAGYDSISEIDFDEYEQCYVSGSFDDSVNLNPNGVASIQLAPNGKGTFIAKSNSSFQFEPIVTMDAGAYCSIFDFEITENNQIHYVNYFSETLNSNFSNTTFQKVSNGSVDVLYGLTDLSGNNVEYVHFGGPFFDRAYSLTQMSNNKFVMFVNYADSLKLDMNGVEVYVPGNNSTNNYHRNIAVVKFDGVEVEWVKTINVQEVNGNPNGYCWPFDKIAVDEYDNLYMALNVTGVCSVNQSNMNTFGSNNSTGTVLTRQNSDGVFTGLYAFSGWGITTGSAIEIIDDQLFLGMSAGGGVDFDLTEVVFDPYTHGMALAKYNLQAPLSSGDILSKFEAIIYPNPANETVHLKDVNISSIRVIDLSGREMIPNYQFTGNEYQINTSELVNGMYILNYEKENSSFTERFVVKH